MDIPDEARAVTPKFGDTVLNRVASEGNPQRVGTFVRKIRRSGRLNPGVWWQITDGRGSFWETPPAIAEVQPAPDIARAAQVQVLREMAERYSKAAGLENAAEDYDERCHDRLLWMATQLGIEADALESP